MGLKLMMFNAEQLDPERQKVTELLLLFRLVKAQQAVPR